MEKLSLNNLKAEINKSEFCLTTIDFLVYEISNGQYRLAKKNAQTILDIPIPKTPKKLESLIGAFNFAAKFIHNFTEKIAPLYDKLKKSKELKNV